MHGEMERVRYLSADTMVGDEVRSSEGEDVGKIESLMIDVHRGCIAYAVLSFGGFLGMGDELYAVPWDALTIMPEDHKFQLNVTEEKLERAPSFNRDDWPTDDQGWLQSIYDYYGYRPYWEM